MKYLVTIKVREIENRFVWEEKGFSMSERRLQEIISVVHELFNEEHNEKITIKEGRLFRYTFESGRLTIEAHPLDTNEVDFIKSAL